MSGRIPLDPIERAAQTLASPLAFESDAAWTRALLADVIRASGADRSHVQWPGEERAVSDSFSEHAIAEYPRFFPLLERVGCFERGQRLGVATRRETYGPHYEAMQETEYVREFLPSVRGFDSLTVSVPHPRHVSAEAASPVQLLLHMAEEGRAFDATHVEIMRRLRPAFAAGVAIQHGIAQAREDVCSLVDVSGGACALFSVDGRLVHQSRTLLALLSKEPLREALVDAVRTLAATALASPARAGSAQFRGRRGLYAMVASEARAFRPLLVVTVTPPPPPSAPDPEALAARFGLTPRQAEVAVLLADRRTNREIADALCISEHTARHHVRAVLLAVGVSRPDAASTLRRGT